MGTRTVNVDVDVTKNNDKGLELCVRVFGQPLSFLALLFP